MPMTLLEMISDPARGAAVRCGVTAPTSLFGSSDPNAPLLIAMAQEECEDLASRHDWQSLLTVQRAVADGTITFTLPSDFDHLARYGTVRNVTLQQIYDGPVLDESTWRNIATGLVVPSLGAWRVSGSGSIFIFPAPAATQAVEYSYFSKNFARSSLGVAKGYFTADNDTTVLPDNVVRLGIIWRWKKDRGLAYAEHMASYERALERAASRDRGLAALIVRKARPNDSALSGTWPGRIIV